MVTRWWKDRESKYQDDLINLILLRWGNHLQWFPLVGAAQSRVSDSPLPAEVGGYVCLWQTLAHSRNAHIR